MGSGGVSGRQEGELCTDAEGTAGSSELLRRGDPDVGTRLLLND